MLVHSLLAVVVPLLPTPQSWRGAVQPRIFVSECGSWAIEVDPGLRNAAKSATYRLFRDGIGVWRAELPFTLLTARCVEGAWVGLAQPRGIPIGEGCGLFVGQNRQPDWKIGVVRPDGSWWLSEPLDPLEGAGPFLRGTCDGGWVGLETRGGEVGFQLSPASFSPAGERDEETSLTLAEVVARRTPRPLPEPTEIELARIGTLELLDSVILPQAAFAPDGRIGVVDSRSGIVHVFDDRGHELGVGIPPIVDESRSCVDWLCVDGWGRFSYERDSARLSFDDQGLLVERTETSWSRTAFSLGTSIEWGSGAGIVARLDRGAKRLIRRSPMDRWFNVLGVRTTPDGRPVVFERDDELGPLLHFFDREGSPLWSLQAPAGADGDVEADEQDVLIQGDDELWLLDQQGRRAQRALFDLDWGSVGFSGDRAEILVVRFESMGERSAAKFPQRVHLDRYRRP